MGLERIAFSCGGTGGHFNPGLAAAREFVTRGGTPKLILGGKHAVTQAAAAEYYKIPSMIFPASPHSLNPVAFFRFVRDFVIGYYRVRKEFLAFRPQALLAMGSFASFAPVLAAKKLGIPVFLHDGNARVGRANRFLSKYANAIALSFPAVNEEELACPAILTGLPLRREIIDSMRRREAAIAEINRRWNRNFSPDKPLILIFGGSLGAQTINTKLIVRNGSPHASELQQIRLVGPGKLAETEPLFKDSAAPVLLLESCREMNLLYSAADLVVCRAGGSTVSELAVYGKFALLLPYPYAAENHQEDNARWLAASGAAEIIHDSECSPEWFTNWIGRWYENREEYTKRGLAGKRLARTNAAANVLDMIENITLSQGGK